MRDNQAMPLKGTYQGVGVPMTPTPPLSLCCGAQPARPPSEVRPGLWSGFCKVCNTHALFTPDGVGAPRMRMPSLPPAPVRPLVLGGLRRAERSLALFSVAAVLMALGSLAVLVAIGAWFGGAR
jgi:hypothetical protein